MATTTTPAAETRLREWQARRGALVRDRGSGFTAVFDTVMADTRTLASGSGPLGV